MIEIFDCEQKNLKKRQRAREWALAHPDRMRAAGRKYHAANAEQRRAAAKAWAEANPEKRKAIDAASRQRRRQQLTERSSQWAKDNPEKAKAIAHAKRARKRGAEGKHTAADTASIRAKQRDRCAYCKVGLKGAGHLDHIPPLSRGGSNWPSNLQWLCEPCNLSKHAKDPIDFAQSIGRLI